MAQIHSNAIHFQPSTTDCLKLRKNYAHLNYTLPNCGTMMTLKFKLKNILLEKIRVGHQGEGLIYFKQ